MNNEPQKGDIRYTDTNGMRNIGGVLIPIGTRVEKYDGNVWIYVDTLPPYTRLTSWIK